MYEIDFLPVGDGQKSGDAIAMRFTRPDTGNYAHVIIDAGFGDDGEALVEHVQSRYGTNSVDLAVLSHADGDHIGGMGKVVRELDVATLCVHGLGDRGGASLPAADAVDDLIEVAKRQGTAIFEPFTGNHAFGGAIRFLGPDENWYEDLVEEQLVRALAGSGARGSQVLERARALASRMMVALPVEVPFTEGEGTSPRNESCIVTMLEVEGFRAVFTADAGVRALDRAWDYLERNGLGVREPDFIQVPHHGSRRNGSSALLNRLLGPTGQSQERTAFVSVVANAPKHPAGRIVNAYSRRGYKVCATAGQTICRHSPDAPARADFYPLTPLGPMVEEED